MRPTFRQLCLRKNRDSHYNMTSPVQMRLLQQRTAARPKSLQIQTEFECHTDLWEHNSGQQLLLQYRRIQDRNTRQIVYLETVIPVVLNFLTQRSPVVQHNIRRLPNIRPCPVLFAVLYDKVACFQTSFFINRN